MFLTNNSIFFKIFGQSDINYTCKQLAKTTVAPTPYHGIYKTHDVISRFVTSYGNGVTSDITVADFN